MKRTAAAVIIGALLIFCFSGLGQCAEKAGAGMLDRIKKAYGDFRNRSQKKEEVKPSTPAIKEVKPPMPAIKKEEAPAAKEEAPAAEEAQPKKAKAELTREEMLADIAGNLSDVDGIFGAIPSLKMVRDESGKESYTHNGVELSQLSEEELKGLFNMVSQQVTRLKTNRIERQLETVRRVEMLNRSVVQTNPGAISGPPRVPPSSPSASKPPSAPPASPPSTRR